MKYSPRAEKLKPNKYYTQRHLTPGNIKNDQAHCTFSKTIPKTINKSHQLHFLKRKYQIGNSMLLFLQRLHQFPNNYNNSI